MFVFLILAVYILEPMSARAATNYNSMTLAEMRQELARLKQEKADNEHQQEVYLGLLDAVNSGEISQERIDESVKRIIKVKLLHLYQWYNLA